MPDPIITAAPDTLTLAPGESAQVAVAVDTASPPGEGTVSITVMVPSQRVVPPTIPHPGITKTNGFQLFVAKLQVGNYWVAPYLYDTPYAPDTGWVAGDRTGYGCAYSFLQQGGEIVGRVAFRRISAADSYSIINDKYMDEGMRFYDGSLTPVAGEGLKYNDCPSSSQPYTTAAVPDQRPKVVYWSSTDEALEIRDYATTQPRAGVTFELVEVIDEPFIITAPKSGQQTVNSRVTVLAREAGVPFAVVYYDGIGTGQVSEEA